MNIKKLIFGITVLVMSGAYGQTSFTTDLPSNQFTPHGWVQEFLNRQVQGLGSHPEESGFPFNTGMWTENMNYQDREYAGGSDWWPYEQTGYYLDGILRCGYMANADILKQKALENVNHILKKSDAEGILHAGDIGLAREGWPMVVIMRMLIETYEATKDTRLLNAIDKHYKTVFSKPEIFNAVNKGGFEIRPVLHVELLAHLYVITGDAWYVNTAEKLYGIFQEKVLEKAGKNKTNYGISAKGMNAGIIPGGHAVTYHEFLKLPAVLYLITGKAHYKTALYKAYSLLEKTHELADGGFSCHEGLSGKDSNESAEACSLIDFGWTTGWSLLATQDAYFADKMEKILYNASFSLVSKDFKAYQYYQMPNLLISTNASSFYNDDVAWGSVAKGRLCYRAGHDTECCAGNIHRMLPTFINRSCLVNGNTLKLALYLPGTVKVPMRKGEFVFTQKTDYPFEHSTRITIDEAPSAKVNFGLRIPGWANAYVIQINGENYKEGTDTAVFKTLSRRFKKGDVIDVSFKTTPKIDNRGNGLAINYGPLVFSYPIESIVRKSTFDSGGKSSTKFPAYEYFPKEIKDAGWAIALPGNLKVEDIEPITTDNHGYPWDIKNSPIKLRVRAKKVTNWNLKNWVEPTSYPKNVEIGDDIMVDLYPEATTVLRITEFPKAKEN